MRLWRSAFKTITASPLRYQSNKYNYFSSIKLGKDEYYLHNFIEKTNKFSIIEKSLSQFDPASLHSMLRIVNNDGKLPIDMCIHNSFITDPEKNELHDLLMKYMKECMMVFPDISKKIDESDISETTKKLFDEDLIGSAVAIGNAAREIIKISNTHPEYNKYPFEKQRFADQLIYRIREETPSLDYDSLYSDNHIRFCSGIIKKYAVGNCYEFAILSKYICKEMNYKLASYILVNEKGDHLVNVFSKNLLPIPNNSGTALSSIDKSSIKSSLVLDSWSGAIYPLRDLYTYGTSYRFIERKKYNEHDNGLNFVPKINPTYHSDHHVHSYGKHQHGIRQFSTRVSKIDKDGVCTSTIGIFASKNKVSVNDNVNGLTSKKAMTGNSHRQ